MKTSVDVVTERVLIDFDFHFRAMRNSFPFKIRKTSCGWCFDVMLNCDSTFIEHWVILEAAKQIRKLIGKMFDTVILSFQSNRKICKFQFWFSEHFFVSPNCLSSSRSKQKSSSSRPPKQRYHNRMCRARAHLIEMRSARATKIHK